MGKGTHKAVNHLHNWLKQTNRKPQRYYYLKLSVASYRGILKHFNSYGLRQSLNELYVQEVGQPYKDKPQEPASKAGLFCGYYGSIDDYIKKDAETEVTQNVDNTDD